MASNVPECWTLETLPELSMLFRPVKAGRSPVIWFSQDHWFRGSANPELPHRLLHLYKLQIFNLKGESREVRGLFVLFGVGGYLVLFGLLGLSGSKFQLV